MESNKLKLIGSAELNESLEINHDYALAVEGTVTDITKSSDEQGGFVYSHKLKLRVCEVLKSNGEIIKAKVKGSESVKTRLAILGIKDQINPEMEDQQFYEAIQQQFRRFLPEVIKFMESLENG